MTIRDHLAALHACPEAVAWAGEQPSLAAAWEACERGDWLLWYAAKRGVDRRLLVRAACACARLVLHLVPAGEDRPRLAIETAEAWCDGRATLAEVQAYAYAAYAAYAADAAAAAYAAVAADARSAMHARCAAAVRSLIVWCTLEVLP